jgi:hypothetical protein
MIPLDFNLQDRSPFDREFTVCKAERLPDLPVRLLDGHDVVDLTGATVTFTMRSEAGGGPKVNAAAGTLVSGPGGTVGYAWAALDVDTPGRYYGQFAITVGGKAYLVPNNSSQRLVVTVGPAI